MIHRKIDTSPSFTNARTKRGKIKYLPIKHNEHFKKPVSSFEFGELNQ